MIETINRNSKLPLYQQIYEILRSAILHGEFKPGDMIPAESELIERYQVSRITVRQVLDMLAGEGLIYRQRGRGTFVAHPRVEQTMVRIVSFTEDMRQRGFEPGTEVLGRDLVPAAPDIAEKLRVPEGAELAHIQRLRLADGEPMSVEDAFLLHRYCPGILARDYATQPLRETLEQHYGLRIVRARQSIRAVQAARAIAEPLSIRAGDPLLLIERVSFSEQDIPIEFLRIYYRGDRYSLYSELAG